MTTHATPEVTRDPAQLAREHAQSFMGPVVDAKSYPGQWSGYEHVKFQAAHDGVLATGLVEYAADEKSTDSLLLRSFALEAGLRGIRSAVLYGTHELSSEEQTIYERAKQIIPEFFNKGAVSKFDGADLPNPSQNRSFHWFFSRLEDQEGIHRMIMPDPHELEQHPDTVVDNVPVATGMLLNRMMRAETYHDVAALPESLANDMLRVALNFQGPEYAAAIADKPSDMGEFAQLARFAERAGYDHTKLVEDLYKLEAAKRKEYVAVLNGLYEAAQLLPEMVPEGLGTGNELGVRKLFAKAMFAVMEHLKNDGHTEDTIPLVSGREVPVVLEGDEMLDALRDLEEGIRGAHEDLTHPDARSMLAVDAPDFRIWRIFRLGRGEPPRTKVTLRPFGNRRYDPQHEFGHPTYGVEAAVQIEHSLGRRTEGLPLSRKRDRRDVTIVIHYDREGHKPEEGHVLYRDPTQVEGTVSLDVDSLYGTSKAGLVLALGDKLRSEAINVECTKNHVTDDLDQYYGQSGPFAKEVLTLDGRLQGKQATRFERRTYQRQLVAASQPKQFLATQVAA